MHDRPAKLSPLAVLVIWASRELTLGEKVVWYRDWTLDRGDADGCYAGATSLSESLGGSVSPGSVETIRKRLKRLGLHQHVRRPDGRNPGWCATLPADCARPRSGKEAMAFARLLDAAILQLDGGLTLETPQPALPGQVVEPRNVRDPVLESGRAQAPSGGVGGVSSQELSETQLPSQDRSVGEGNVLDAQMLEKRDEPFDANEGWQEIKDKLRARRKQA